MKTFMKRFMYISLQMRYKNRVKTPTAVGFFFVVALVVIVAGVIMWGTTTTFSVFVPPGFWGNPQQKTAEEKEAEAEKAAGRPTAPVRFMEDGIWVTVVNYTGTRFVPELVTINLGEQVRFVNKDNLSMRITSNDIKGAPLYPGFDQQKSGGTGSTFTFLFNKAGLWPYHNLNGDPGVVGVVFVKTAE
jgi:plastocyanin